MATKSGRSMETDMFNIPIKKKNINGKLKGNANEREAAKPLSAWMNVKLVRSPQSGALRWDDNEKTVSDLIVDKKNFYFPFILETKHLKSIHIEKLLGSKSMIYTIWHQVNNDAIRAGKLPMALLRSNGMPKFEYNGVKYQDYYVVVERRGVGNFLFFKLPIVFTGRCEDTDYQLVGFMLSDLIKSVSYKQLAAHVKSSNLVAQFLSYARPTQ